MSKLDPKYVTQQFIIPGGYGHAFPVKKDQLVTITDIKGQQVIDFIAFTSVDHSEYLSVTQTRTTDDERLFLQKGDKLLTNLRNPIAQIVEDTVEVHDLLIAACDPAYYAGIGDPNHRSCHQNFVDVLEPYGIEEWQRPDPFNIFQNTEIRSDGSYFYGDPPSDVGDYIQIRFLTDALCAVSSCPYDLEGFNNGKPTPIQVQVS